MDKRYWDGNGLHQTLHHQLVALIPKSGPVQKPRKNKALERFRKATNCYYDLYNNDLINRAKEFREVFHIKSSRYRFNAGYGTAFSEDMYDKVEKSMNALVMNAAIEQDILETKLQR